MQTTRCDTHQPTSQHFPRGSFPSLSPLDDVAVVKVFSQLSIISVGGSGSLAMAQSTVQRMILFATSVTK